MRRSLRTGSAALVLLLLFSQIWQLAEAREIHRERSLYRNIVVVKEGAKLCMRFETRRRKTTNQACMDESDPDRLVFTYTRTILSSLFLNPSPKRILVIGLGGGSLPRALAQLLPDATITSVEIDPAVAELARRYFRYEETDRIHTEIKDGRVFIKRAALRQQQFDWIILDAFNGDYIPEHLMTREFLQEVRSVLAPGGIVAANTFSSSQLYSYESETYRDVFGRFYNLRPRGWNNRIILACNCDIEVPEEQLERAAEQWSPRLQPYGVDTDYLLQLFSLETDWDRDVPLLTDQYSPANLLNTGG